MDNKDLESCTKVAFDMMIDKLEQLKKMQENLGMYIVDDECSALVYDDNRLLEYANELGQVVQDLGYTAPSGRKKVGFYYRECCIHTFVEPQEMERYKEKTVCAN